MSDLEQKKEQSQDGKTAAPSPVKVVIRTPLAKERAHEPVETEEDKEKQRSEQFVRMVLEDEPKVAKRITRNFRKTKKEAETVQLIEQATRFAPLYDKGLTTEQVESRKAEKLTNIAKQKNEKTYASIFVKNICTFFNLLCVVVATALISVGRWKDLTFMIIMTFNTVIGIVQECRSKRMIEKLSIISAPVVTVVRNCERKPVAVEEVVLDDVMYLENGKQICADSVVLKGVIQVNEAMLTGESALVTKKEGDVLYAGSFVVSGTCYARAEKIGNANYIESLTAFARRYKKSGSELLTSLRKLIGVISVLIIPISIVMFYNNYQSSGSNMEVAISATAGAIIGMIPAGMFLLTSVALAVTVIKLAKNRVLVQDLYCIEMLARTDVLCLDKTGTITDGTMAVSSVVNLRTVPSGAKLNEVVGSMLLATKDNNQTAVALGNHFGYNGKMKPLAVMPFSSQRKFSAVTFEDEGTFFLGAPEFIIPEMDARLAEIVEAKAKEGMRVIMIAHSSGEIRGERLPAGRKAIALVCIEDHIRDDAPDTIAWFKNNDVAVKVISGDNPITVSEVAQRAGIENADRYISLEGMSDHDVVEVADRYTVFGRVTPEQKRLLVRAIKLKGHTVAMTGDGVNDILALKEADCSVAMATGSEAARNVSHMVLMDSNFGNMPTVVLEGRKVINNIQKSASLYTMKTMFSFLLSIIVIVVGTTVPMAYPVTPSNLLLLELLIIGLPSFALAFQPNTNRIKGRFLSNLVKESCPGGLSLVLGFLALFVYSRIVSLPDDVMTGMTVLIITFTGFTLLVKLCQPLNLYRAVLCIGIFLMIGGVVALSMIGEGFFRHMFSVPPLDLTNTLFVICVVMLSYVVASAISLIIRAAERSKHKQS